MPGLNLKAFKKEFASVAPQNAVDELSTMWAKLLQEKNGLEQQKNQLLLEQPNASGARGQLTRKINGLLKDIDAVEKAREHFRSLIDPPHVPPHEAARPTQVNHVSVDEAGAAPSAPPGLELPPAPVDKANAARDVQKMPLAPPPGLKLPSAPVDKPDTALDVQQVPSAPPQGLKLPSAPVDKPDAARDVQPVSSAATPGLALHPAGPQKAGKATRDVSSAAHPRSEPPHANPQTLSSSASPLPSTHTPSTNSQGKGGIDEGYAPVNPLPTSSTHVGSSNARGAPVAAQKSQTASLVLSALGLHNSLKKYSLMQDSPALEQPASIPHADVDAHAHPGGESSASNGTGPRLTRWEAPNKGKLADAGAKIETPGIEKAVVMPPKAPKTPQVASTYETGTRRPTEAPSVGKAVVTHAPGLPPWDHDSQPIVVDAQVNSKSDMALITVKEEAMLDSLGQSIQQGHSLWDGETSIFAKGKQKKTATSDKKRTKAMSANGESSAKGKGKDERQASGGKKAGEPSDKGKRKRQASGNEKAGGGGTDPRPSTSAVVKKRKVEPTGQKASEGGEAEDAMEVDEDDEDEDEISEKPGRKVKTVWILDEQYRILGDATEPKRVSVRVMAPAKETPFKREQKLALGDVALHNLHAGGILFPASLLVRARRYRDFVPEIGATCRLWVMGVFILSNKLTRCHRHSMSDRMAAINDLEGKKIERTGDVSHTVTGVPLTKSSQASPIPPGLDPEDAKEEWTRFRSSLPYPKRLGAAVIPERIPTVLGGLSEKDLLRFFRLHEGKYYLHCGCPLDEAIFDFFLWKTAPPIVSPTSGAVECLGTPLDPRIRHTLLSLMNKSGGFGPDQLDKAFKYNREGKLNDLSKAPPFVQIFWKEIEARNREKSRHRQPKISIKPKEYVEVDELQGPADEDLFSEDEELDPFPLPSKPDPKLSKLNAEPDDAAPMDRSHPSSSVVVKREVVPPVVVKQEVVPVSMGALRATASTHLRRTEEDGKSIIIIDSDSDDDDEGFTAGNWNGIVGTSRGLGQSGGSQSDVEIISQGPGHSAGSHSDVEFVSRGPIHSGGSQSDVEIVFQGPVHAGGSQGDVEIVFQGPVYSAGSQPDVEPVLQNFDADERGLLVEDGDDDLSELTESDA